MSLPSSPAGIRALPGHRTACRRRDVFFIFLFQKFKQVGDQRFLQKIAFESAVDKVIKETVRAKNREVLRYVRLADIKSVLEVAHALHTVSEIFEDLNADGMG